MSAEFRAYYYAFDATGNDLVDSILREVAAAGKGFHHTEYWGDELPDGTNHIDRIQTAANLAANTLHAKD